MPFRHEFESEQEKIYKIIKIKIKIK
uniref:Uncharacterized protein n=1 Tax=Rhizophora mucronata TaxID=61149 RepID=A0A2P2NBQ0_RHIMU